MSAAGSAYAHARAGLARFRTWDRHRGGFRLVVRYGYRPDTGPGVSEATAVPDGRLLVLERGFTAGVDNTVRLRPADPRHATDGSGT
ncbi:esterase-like activity of phytase family protein [Streptomyces avermitilis]